MTCSWDEAHEVCPGRDSKQRPLVEPASVTKDECLNHWTTQLLRCTCNELLPADVHEEESFVLSVSFKTLCIFYIFKYSHRSY
jgi:hypothetical protein